MPQDEIRIRPHELTGYPDLEAAFQQRFGRGLYETGTAANNPLHRGRKTGAVDVRTTGGGAGAVGQLSPEEQDWLRANVQRFGLSAREFEAGGPYPPHTHIEPSEELRISSSKMEAPDLTAKGEPAQFKLARKFEKAKAQGNLENAQRLGQQLQQQFGYEYGESDGWPYIKAPREFGLSSGGVFPRESPRAQEILLGTPGGKVRQVGPSPTPPGFLERARQFAGIPGSVAELGKLFAPKPILGGLVSEDEPKLPVGGLGQLVEFGRGLVEPAIGEINRAQELAKERGLGGRGVLGDPEIMGHLGAAVLPFFGPPAARVGEIFGEGDVEGGLGAATGLATQFLPIPFGRRLMGGTKPKVSPTDAPPTEIRVPPPTPSTTMQAWLLRTPEGQHIISKDPSLPQVPASAATKLPGGPLEAIMGGLKFESYREPLVPTPPKPSIPPTRRSFITQAEGLPTTARIGPESLAPYNVSSIGRGLEVPGTVPPVLEAMFRGRGASRIENQPMLRPQETSTLGPEREPSPLGATLPDPGSTVYLKTLPDRPLKVIDNSDPTKLVLETASGRTITTKPDSLIVPAGLEPKFDLVKKIRERMRAARTGLFGELTPPKPEGMLDVQYKPTNHTLFLSDRALTLLRSTDPRVKGVARGMMYSPTEVWDRIQGLRQARNHLKSPESFTLVDDLINTLVKARTAQPSKGLAIVGRQITNIRSTIRHERAHQVQNQSSPSISLDINPILNSPLYIKAVSELGSQYDNHPPHHLVDEITARIIGGQLDTIGLSHPEAKDFLKTYFEEVKKAHGPESVAAFESIHPAFKRIRDTVIGDLGPGSTRPDLASPVRGLPGEPGGVREDVRRTVPGGRSTGLYDIAPDSRRSVARFLNPLNIPRLIDNVAGPQIKHITDKLWTAGLARTPAKIRALISEDPATNGMITEGIQQVEQWKNAAEGILFLYTGEAKRQAKEQAPGLFQLGQRKRLTQEILQPELLIADQIARGVTTNLMGSKMMGVQIEAAERIHALAQELTSLRKSLGLPIREEWLSGPSHWYPLLFKQHVMSPRMIGGRLWASMRPGGGAKTPTAQQMGSVKYPRTLDRWAVTDFKGRMVRDKGQFMLFTDEASARDWIKQNERWTVEFYDKGEPKRGNRKEIDFDSKLERTNWIEQNSGHDGTVQIVRTHDPKHHRLVEPMPLEAQQAHGLLEDVAINLRYGFGQQFELLGRTGVLDKIGKAFAVDDPRQGYVRLTDKGYSIPTDLVKRNPDIQRLAEGYVPESVATTMAAFYGPSGYWSRNFRRFEGVGRKMVTVWNPTRHPRQLAENELFLAFASPEASLNPAARKRAIENFYSGINGRSKTSVWDQYMKTELPLSDIKSAEFSQFWRAADPTTFGDDLSLGSQFQLWLRTNKLGRGMLASDKFMGDLYRAEDQIYKYYLFEYLMEKQGLSPEAAAQQTIRSFFDYVNVPPIVRIANRYAPFIVNTTFQFARVFGTALRDHPTESLLKIAVAWASYGAIRNRLLTQSGITDQDLTNLENLAPEFWELILPVTDAEGRNIKLNMGWLFAFGEILNISNTFEEEDFGIALHQLLRRGIPMVAQPILSSAWAQRDPWGRPLIKGTEDSSDQYAKIRNALVLGYTPAIMGAYWERAYSNAQKGEAKRIILDKNPDFWSRTQETFLESVVEPVVGRMEPFDVRETLELRHGLRESKGRDVQEQSYTARGQMLRGTTTEKTMKEEAERLSERLKDPDVTNPLVLDVVEAVEAAEKGEIDPSSVQAAFKSLVDSNQYRDEEAAYDAVNRVLQRTERLSELSATHLGRTRELGKLVTKELEQTGEVSDDTYKQFIDSFINLSDSEQDAMMEWITRRLQDAQERSKRPNKNIPLTR